MLSENLQLLVMVSRTINGLELAMTTGCRTPNLVCHETEEGLQIWNK